MQKPMSKLKILVVEDEFMVAITLSDMIEDAGGEVVGPVAHLREAKEKLSREDVDGAILDVQLDGENSLPLAEELMSRGTPVILTTGYSRSVLPERFAAVPHLPKPFRQPALIRAVDEHIRHH